MIIQFFVSGIPKAQPRVKFARRGAFSKAYTPDTANDWKSLVMEEAKRNCTQKLTGPVSVCLSFYFPRPKSHFDSKGVLKPGAPVYHTTKPDRDNLDKCVLDALTSIGAWDDDCQVCAGAIRKCYVCDNELPGCSVVITQLSE